MKKQLKTTHSERLVIRISKDFHEQIKQAACENEMSVSAYVRYVLKNRIKEERNV